MTTQVNRGVWAHLDEQRGVGQNEKRESENEPYAALRPLRPGVRRSCGHAVGRAAALAVAPRGTCAPASTETATDSGHSVAPSPC